MIVQNPNVEGYFSVLVVYKHPQDYPNDYVARWQHSKHANLEINEVLADKVALVSQDYDALRHILQKSGLNLLPRHETDAPVILETWA